MNSIIKNTLLVFALAFLLTGCTSQQVSREPATTPTTPAAVTDDVTTTTPIDSTDDTADTQVIEKPDAPTGADAEEAQEETAQAPLEFPVIEPPVIELPLYDTNYSESGRATENEPASPPDTAEDEPPADPDQPEPDPGPAPPDVLPVE